MEYHLYFEILLLLLQSSEFSHLNQDIQNGYSKTADSEADKSDDKNFLMKQVKLQQEAKMALAQVSISKYWQHNCQYILHFTSNCLGKLSAKSVCIKKKRSTETVGINVSMLTKSTLETKRLKMLCDSSKGIT